MGWMLSLTCMANHRVEAALSMPCIYKLLRTLHTALDLTSDSHPPIVTRSKYVLGRASE